MDGKAICGTAKSGNPHRALQILSAYMTVVLAQEAIREKTNEIPVFPEMLTYLDVEGKTVTADAIRCQRETCRRIVQRKGNYLFGLKENQPLLLEDVRLFSEKQSGQSSRDASAKELMELAREHWKIESMHWILDVTFSEDGCRFLSEDAPKSMNALRKFALAVHKNFLVTHHKKSSIFLFPQGNIVPLACRSLVRSQNWNEP